MPRSLRLPTANSRPRVAITDRVTALRLRLPTGKRDGLSNDPTSPCIIKVPPALRPHPRLGSPALVRYLYWSRAVPSCNLLAFCSSSRTVFNRASQIAGPPARSANSRHQAASLGNSNGFLMPRSRMLPRIISAFSFPPAHRRNFTSQDPPTASPAEIPISYRFHDRRLWPPRLIPRRHRDDSGTAFSPGAARIQLCKANAPHGPRSIARPPVGRSSAAIRLSMISVGIETIIIRYFQ